MSDRFHKAFLRAQERASQRNRIYGTLGRQNKAGHPDGSFTFQVPGRPTFVFVTMRLSSGAQSVIPARNDAGVPWRARLAVELGREGTTYFIVRQSGRQDLSKSPPSDPSGVPVHTHVHGLLLELGEDDHPQYHTDARGDLRYYQKTEHVALSVGAADAGKPLVLDAGGKLDVSFLDSEDIQDIVGPFFVDSSSIDYTYTDGSNTITSIVIDEYIQDLIGAMVTGNTETDIAVTYDDSGAKLNFVVSTNTEAVQDIIGAFLVDSTSIDFTYNDAGNSMTVAVIAEFIEDTIGAMVSGNTETNVAVTYDDATAKLNFVVSTNTEDVQDIIGAFLVDSSSINYTYDDSGNALTTVVIDEYLQDIVGAMVSGGTETNISVTYDDTNGRLDFVVSTNTEDVQDIIGAFLVDSTSIDFTYNDAGNAITVAVIDEYIQDVIGAMVSSNTETGISVTYDDTGAKLNFDAQTAGDARYAILSGPNTFTGDQTVSAGDMILANNKVFRVKDTGGTARSMLVLNSSDIAMLGPQAGSYPTHIFSGTGTPAIVALASGLVLVGGLTSGNATILGVKAGTSSNDAAVGGVLYTSVTQTGNVGAGEDLLGSYTVPANTLDANSKNLWFEATGTFASTAATKRLTVRFGTAGTTLILDTVAGFGGTAEVWQISGRIYRSGAATQKANALAVISNTMRGGVTTALNQTLSGAVDLRILGEATNNNDILIETFIVGWDDANT